MKHTTPIQIRMSDIDPFGHVNNGAQCNLFDYARSNYIETVSNTKIDWLTFDLVLVNINIDFKKQILIHDNIVCETEIYEIGNKSMKMRQQLIDANSGEVKSICHSVFAGIDRQKNVSKEIPELYRKTISTYEGWE